MNESIAKESYLYHLEKIAEHIFAIAQESRVVDAPAAPQFAPCEPELQPECSTPAEPLEELSSPTEHVCRGKNEAQQLALDVSQEVTDNPLKHEHLVRHSMTRGRVIPGNNVFRQFMKEKTADGGQYPIVDFYTDFQAYLVQNGYCVATRKGMRYLIHRNGYTIKNVCDTSLGYTTYRPAIVDVHAF